MEKVIFPPKTYAIAKEIVRLALDHGLPVSKIKSDVMRDCDTVLEQLAWKPTEGDGTNG